MADFGCFRSTVHVGLMVDKYVHNINMYIQRACILMGETEPVNFCWRFKSYRDPQLCTVVVLSKSEIRGHCHNRYQKVLVMPISARGRRLSLVLTLVKRYTKPQTTTNSCSYALIERSRYKERKQKKNAARRPENEQIAAHMRFWLSNPKCGGTMNGPHRKGSCGKHEYVVPSGVIHGWLGIPCRWRSSTGESNQRRYPYNVSPSALIIHQPNNKQLPSTQLLVAVYDSHPSIYSYTCIRILYIYISCSIVARTHPQ